MDESIYELRNLKIVFTCVYSMGVEQYGLDSLESAWV